MPDVALTASWPPMVRRRIQTSAVSVILASAMFVVLIYVGSYFVLMTPMPYNSLKGTGPSPTTVSRKVARYRFGGGLAETVFRPMHWIDRRIRQDTWNGSDEENGTSLVLTPRDERDELGRWYEPPDRSKPARSIMG
jgi:hypothetical protein